MFEKWLELDPVDNQEQYRNESIYKRQLNRNPFIDIPNLASIIGEQQFIDIEKSSIKK